MNTAATGDRPAVRAAVYLLLAGLLGALLIQHAGMYGKLLTGPIDDDAFYYWDGLRRAQTVQTHGLPAALAEWVADPPHTPWSSAVCAISFLVFGAHDASPMLLNVLVVFALLWLIDRLTPELSLARRLPLMALALAAPMTGTLITEARPDSAHGLLTAAGLLMLLRRPLHEQSRNGLLGTGAVAALALLMKPTFFPFTLFVFGVAFVCQAAAAPLVHRRGAGEPWRRLGWLLLPVLVLAGPWFGVVGGHIVAYIREHVLGESARLWAYPHTPWQSAMFFLVGDGGYWMFGRLLPLIALLVAGGLVWTLAQRQRGHAAMGVMAAVVLATAYLFPTLNPTKNQFFATTFQFLALLLAVLALGGMVQSRLRPLRVAAWAVLPASLLLFIFPRALGTPADARVQAGNRIERQIADAIERHRPTASPRVHFTTSGNPVQMMLLRYRALQRGWAVQADDLHRHGDLELHRRAMLTSDFIVASESGGGIARDRLPSGQVQDELLAMARSVPAVRVLAKLPELNGRQYWLFQRVGEFGGWDDASGLGPLEGPYPQWDLPQVRWGLAPQVELKVCTPEALTLRVEWLASSPAAAQRVTVLIAGEECAAVDVTPEATPQSIALHLPAGEHRIALRFAAADRSNADGLARAVLFRRLRLVAGE